jgi:hypothetical protein
MMTPENYEKLLGQWNTIWVCIVAVCFFIWASGRVALALIETKAL